MSLSIHPGGRRLLVHCRSLSTPVIMIDLKLHTIMQTFMGSQSFKNRVNSCITPCGTYVISSSQDGAVYVWNADTGQQVHISKKKNKKKIFFRKKIMYILSTSSRFFFYFNIRYFSLPILGPSIYFSFGRYGCQIRSRSELCSFLPN